MTRHLGPAFKGAKLADLRPNHLQSLYGRKLAGEGGRPGLSECSVHHLQRVLHNALKDAVRWNYVPRNVADAVRPPQPPRAEHNVWTPEQARAFLAGIAGERLEAAFVLAITCGLRAGEIYGLRWEDVDLEAGALQVRRTRQRVPRATWADGERKTIVADGAPKTKKGERLVVLPALTVAALRRWRTAQKEEQLLAGPLWAHSGYVFTYRTGSGLEPRDLYRAFIAVEKGLDLPRIRLHDLRHTCATILLSQGVHAKYVQELLGHSQITVTMDLYAAFLPPMAKEVARTMEHVLAVG